jgi:hypothetical protein
LDGFHVVEVAEHGDRVRVVMAKGLARMTNASTGFIKRMKRQGASRLTC